MCPVRDEQGGRSVRTTRRFVALATVVAACGSSSGPDTTEALLPIATASTAAPIAGSSAAPATSAPETDVLSATQREAVEHVIAAYSTGDAAAIIAEWDIASDRRVLFEQELEFDIAIGGRWSHPTCGLSLSGEARCEMFYTNDLLDALGAPPQESVFRIGVRDDGAITSWFYQTGNAATMQAMAEPFRDWIVETHPDSFTPMFNRGGFARVTPESRQIWVDKLAEFIASRG